MKEIELPSRLENLEEIIVFILGVLAEMTEDKLLINRVNLACEEAIVNVINYAYEGEKGNIRVECDIRQDKGQFIVRIINWGVPYNPLLKEDPDINIPIEKRKIGGLGVYMYKTIMDKVIYEYKDNKNILTLVKKV